MISSLFLMAPDAIENVVATVRQDAVWVWQGLPASPTEVGHKPGHRVRIISAICLFEQVIHQFLDGSGERAFLELQDTQQRHVQHERHGVHADCFLAFSATAKD